MLLREHVAPLPVVASVYWVLACCHNLQVWQCLCLCAGVAEKEELVQLIQHRCKGVKHA